MSGLSACCFVYIIVLKTAYLEFNAINKLKNCLYFANSKLICILNYL